MNPTINPCQVGIETRPSISACVAHPLGKVCPLVVRDESNIRCPCGYENIRPPI
jgi:hypothetical protein